MIGRPYRLPVAAVASPAAAFDFAELNAHSSRLLLLCGLELGQSSDAGDAQDEQLGIQIISGYSTSGSGGSSATPLTNPNNAAFGGTAETMNTTVATGGSPVVEWAGALNVRGGYVNWIDLDFQLLFAASARIVVRVSAPADALTMSGTLLFKEIG